MPKKPYIIALEEHYLDPEVKQLGGGPGADRDIVERLDDLGALRIREMDEAGIDLQVLSHSIPGLQAVDAEAGPPLARRTNDRLHEAVQRHPDRFSAFACRADRQSTRCGRRTGARRHQARLQGRDGQRHDRRRLSRR
jgi:predicted TIM-barrel fold metal-dependent hydrolase